jgi:hypothetical protein
MIAQAPLDATAVSRRSNCSGETKTTTHSECASRQPPCRFHSVHPGHAHVHQDEVGAEQIPALPRVRVAEEHHAQLSVPRPGGRWRSPR